MFDIRLHMNMLVKFENFHWSRDRRGYRWRDGRDGIGGAQARYLTPIREKRHSIGDDEWFVPIRIDDRDSEYSPTKIENLFFQFASIDPTEDGILRFAQNFGELALEETAAFEQPALELFGLRKHQEEGAAEIARYGRLHSYIAADSFDLWTREISSMSLAYRCWRAIHQNDNNGIESLESEIHATLGIYDVKTKLTEVRHFGEGKDLLEETVMFLCNRGLDGRFSVRSKMTPGKTGRERYVTPKNLIGAIWHQFLIATGDERWRACEICGKPFQGRSDAKYCGSSCRSRAHFKRHGGRHRVKGDKP
jgi:hypothetical protein